MYLTYIIASGKSSPNFPPNKKEWKGRGFLFIIQDRRKSTLEFCFHRSLYLRICISTNVASRNLVLRWQHTGHTKKESQLDFLLLLLLPKSYSFIARKPLCRCNGKLHNPLHIWYQPCSGPSSLGEQVFFLHHLLYDSSSNSINSSSNSINSSSRVAGHRSRPPKSHNSQG